jgi:porin
MVAGSAVPARLVTAPVTPVGEGWAAEVDPAPAPSFRQNPKAVLQAKGFDIGLSLAQVYQGVISGDPEDTSGYSGRFAVDLSVDGEKIRLWRGFGISAIGEAAFGDTALVRTPILLPVNTAVLFPAFARDADVSVTVNQRFGERATLTAGKINLSTVLKRAPLLGGGGVDTFMNVNLAAPVSGITPPYLAGAILNLATRPLRYTVMAYDPRNAQSTDVWTHLFAEGVVVSVSAMRSVPIEGLEGTHTLRGAYSTATGTDLRDIPALFPPGGPTAPLGTKQGSYYVSYTFTQNLVQRVPTQSMTNSWGLFGQVGLSDSNPNPVATHGYLGIGGSSLLANRPIDRFGVAFFWLAFSDELREPLNEILGAGLRAERGVEIFYNYAVSPWLRLTPNVQVVRQGLPGRTATVGGVRAEVRF